MIGQQFNKELALPEEIEQRNRIIYSDIPSNLISNYAQNEEEWFYQEIEKLDSFHRYPNPEEFMPIGINKYMGIGVVSPMVSEIKDEMSKFEIEQYLKSWKDKLLRCRYKIQYDHIQRTFLIYCKDDPQFKTAVEQLLRDNELLQFKQNLPEMKDDSDKIEGLTSTAVERINQPIEITPSCTVYVEPQTENRGNSLFKIVTFRYNTKKQWATTLRYYGNQIPAFATEKNGRLLSAQKVSPSICQIIYRDLSHGNNKIVKTSNISYPEHSHPILAAIDSVKGTFAVSDGKLVHSGSVDSEEIIIAKIENETVTAISISDKYLFIGTLNGLYYKIDLDSGKLLHFTKNVDALAITGISHSANKKVILQTITDVQMIEGMLYDSVIQYNIDRPISSLIHGGKIMILNKSAILRMFPTYGTQKVEGIYMPPEDLRCYFKLFTPWYQNGIYIDQENGDKIAVLLQDGTILLRKVGKLVK